MNRCRLALLLPLLALGLGLPGCAQSSRLAGELTLPDVAGHPVRPLAGTTNRAVVCVFLANECPISNRAIPELLRLQEAFAAQGVTFWFVHPNADETDDSVRRHASEYKLPGQPLRDPGLKLAHLLGAVLTPTAVVLAPTGEVRYRGRIDDRYAGLGQARPEPTRHDLELALTAVLHGQLPEPSETRAVGCRFAEVP